MVATKEHRREVMNLTIRNLPDEVVSRIRSEAAMQRRSLNSQLLFVLERGLKSRQDSSQADNLQFGGELQTKIWKALAGKWEDDRSTKEIVDDIYKSRTLGRDFDI